MKKRQLGKTGMNVSAIAYGGIVSMDFTGAPLTGKEQEDSDRYVKYAIDHGVNYFDVAPSYGNAEERLGDSLRPYRKDVYLACKTQKRTAEEAKAELENSLEHLHTDHFDLYQVHSLRTVADVETIFGKGGCMEVFFKAKEEGVAKRLGITCHSDDAAIRALSLYDFDTVMFPTNWGLHLGKGFAGKVAQAKKEKGFGFLCIKAFIERAWANDEERYASRFPKSWCKPIDDGAWMLAAMKYTLSLGADVLIPPGNFENFSFAVEHIDECLANPLSGADMELLRSKLPEVAGKDFF